MRKRGIEKYKKIEKEFWHIKDKIDQLQKNSQIPPTILFQQLDNEFKEIQKIYGEWNDKINLLHVEHNYLWSKSFQYLHEDPTQSLSLVIEAFSKLLDRHQFRLYQDDKFENMLGKYESALIKISKKRESIKLIRF